MLCAKKKPVLVFLLVATTSVLAGSGVARAASQPINLLFLGDSITDASWGGGGYYVSPLR
jgi:hypothetical protein